MMKKKSVTAAVYAGAGILACFYLLVVWWGKNPDVGLEYRMYYLTHELSDWPGYGKLSYEPGTTEYCTTLKDKDGNERSINVCRRKGKGWKEDQYEGSTNSGKDAYLYYVLNRTAENASYQCEVTEFAGNGRVEVYCNDRKIGEIQGTGTFTFEIGKLEEKECDTIHFVADNVTFCLWSSAIL